MAGRKSPSTDFESRYLDGLEDDIKAIRTTLDEVLVQTQKTNGRVTKLEEHVFDTPAKKDLPSVLRDPKFLQIVWYLSLAVLLIAASVTGFNITGLLT